MDRPQCITIQDGVAIDECVNYNQFNLGNGRTGISGESGDKGIKGAGEPGINEPPNQGLFIFCVDCSIKVVLQKA